MLDSSYKKDNISHEDIKKSVAVWLIIKDGLNRGKIALQKRSTFGGQSYRDIFQPTWNGKMEEGESLIDAIKREAQEELGKDFYDNFDFSLLTQFGFDSFEFNGKKCISYNFIGNITENQIKKVIMHPEALPDFFYIDKENLKNIKSKNDTLADLQENIVLFDDQYNFLVKFLNSKQYHAFY